MSQHHLERLQKQRVNLDRRVTIAITMGGWLVLVTLLVMVWHLFSATQPLLNKPETEAAQEYGYSTSSALMLAYKSGDEVFLFGETGRCHIEVSHKGAIAATALTQSDYAFFQTSKRVYQPGADTFSSSSLDCQQQRQLIKNQRGVFLAEMSSQGILRLSPFQPERLAFGDTIFSVRIPSETNVNDFHQSDSVRTLSAASFRDTDWETSDKEKLDWQVNLTGKSLSLLLSVEPGKAAFYGFDIQTRDIQTAREVITGNSDKATLVQSDKLSLLFTDRNMLLSDHSNPTWQVFRTSDNAPILDVISLSTQRSVLLLDDNFNIEKWSILNVNGQKVLKNIFNLSLSDLLTSEENLSSEHNKEYTIAHIDGDLVALVVPKNPSIMRVIFVNATTGEVLNVEDIIISSDISSYSVDASYMQFIDKQLLVRYQKANKGVGSQHLFSQEKPSEQSQIQIYDVINASSTLTFQSFWGKVWYDGYPEPEYVWQTSSASDQQQAKFSVLPLLIGSVKAAFLALIVAIPLAIGSAIYTAYYAGRRIRKIIKPYVEVLEAIPSVVIGFIAAIWLMPVSENYLLATLLFLILTPIFLVVFIWLNETKRHLNVAGWELMFFVGVIVCYLIIFKLVLAENQFLLSRFLASEIGGTVSTELKNTFVLALALGIAIVPTVFTIAEDAIYQVPKSMSLASFALGATRSQTLLRIVIKVALPGIISAVMLGFARAVGETMIVLMVSGNTPVADWDIFEGIRTMTANLAIELPEAQPDSVHYQILFFVALLLFGFTFIFNTLAELLRFRLRNRYRL